MGSRSETLPGKSNRKEGSFRTLLWFAPRSVLAAGRVLGNAQKTSSKMSRMQPARPVRPSFQSPMLCLEESGKMLLPERIEAIFDFATCIMSVTRYMRI